MYILQMIQLSLHTVNHYTIKKDSNTSLIIIIKCQTLKQNKHNQSIGHMYYYVEAIDQV